MKVAHQSQADKPIYLLSTGVIQCGRFEYRGRFRSQFKDVFARISDVTFDKPRSGELDVSGYREWDAIAIYNDYVLRKWCRTVSAKRIERFATETMIVRLLDGVRAEFLRSLGLKWKKIFKVSDKMDPATPRHAWQIL